MYMEDPAPATNRHHVSEPMLPARPEKTIATATTSGPPTRRNRLPHRSGSHPSGTLRIRRANPNAATTTPTAATLTPNRRAKTGRTGPRIPWPVITKAVAIETITTCS